MRNVCDFESHVYFNNMKFNLQITIYEMTQSSCKRETKSKSHPGMKLAPVRVFSYKRPLREYKTVLDSGFHTADSRFQVLDSSL